MSDFIRKPDLGDWFDALKGSAFWHSLEEMVSDFCERSAAVADENEYFTYSGMGSVMGFVHVKSQTVKTKGKVHEVQKDKAVH